MVAWLVMFEPGCFCVGRQDVSVAEGLVTFCIDLEAKRSNSHGFCLACDQIDGSVSDNSQFV